MRRVVVWSATLLMGHGTLTAQTPARQANQATYFVDTGSFAGNNSTTTQFEVVANNGPTQVFGELMLTPVDAPSVGDPFFYGGFAGASYFLTGESRPFNREDGHYVGSFKPRSPFRFRNPGLGAWELSARYSYVDLTDGAVDGGMMARLTGGISWYPNGTGGSVQRRAWRL